MSDIGNKKIMSKNLNYYISVSGKSKIGVAEELGFPYTTFLDWVNGKFYPRIDKIEHMANYFGIQKSDLIEDKNVSISRLELLFNKYKNILTKDDEDTIIFIIEKRVKEKKNE